MHVIMLFVDQLAPTPFITRLACMPLKRVIRTPVLMTVSPYATGLFLQRNVQPFQLYPSQTKIWEG
jgi:hypothetical protein